MRKETVRQHEICAVVFPDTQLPGRASRDQSYSIGAVTSQIAMVTGGRFVQGFVEKLVKFLQSLGVPGGFRVFEENCSTRVRKQLGQRLSGREADAASSCICIREYQ